jgi:hypothetical protein
VCKNGGQNARVLVISPALKLSAAGSRSFLLIPRSAAAGLNIFAVTQGHMVYMVSVVEGLKPAGVSGMMTGGGSGTNTEHGERWDKNSGLDPTRSKPGSCHNVCTPYLHRICPPNIWETGTSLIIVVRLHTFTSVALGSQALTDVPTRKLRVGPWSILDWVYWDGLRSPV